VSIAVIPRYDDNGGCGATGPARFLATSHPQVQSADSHHGPGSSTVIPSARARGRLDAGRLRELRQEFLIGGARVAPHDAA